LLRDLLPGLAQGTDEREHCGGEGGVKRITFIKLEFSDGDFIAWPIRNGYDWFLAAKVLWRYRKGTYETDEHTFASSDAPR
jgi:hypothetical protein